MDPIHQPERLRAFYQDRDVVDSYLVRRTAQPLNGLLHRRQVAFLNSVIRRLQPRRVLEVACGPGRLTAEIRDVPFGVAVDASIPMLQKAAARTRSARWQFLRGDAFCLPFRDESFDLVYTARFIRHFREEERTRLYAEIRRLLRPTGILVVDALNREVCLPARLERGLDQYRIYDVLYGPGEAEQELQRHGFRVLEVEGVLRHFPIQRKLNRLRFRAEPLARWLIECLEKLPGRRVNTWMIVCQRET
jgi:ubiquinone/menaquinone biosynthesis C-methylase UbiE